MLAVNYSNLRENMKSYMDQVSDNFETVIITRKEERNIVMISETAYNNLLENAYLTENKANYDWLTESKKQFEAGKISRKELIEP